MITLYYLSANLWIKEDILVIKFWNLIIKLNEFTIYLKTIF